MMTKSFKTAILTSSETAHFSKDNNFEWSEVVLKRTLTEMRVLKRLGIPDFRHMTKDNVVKFATMLPYMNPEVAKKALEQFPAFKDMALDMVSEYKGFLEKALDENKTSQQAFYDTCNSILSSLQGELEKESIQPEERRQIEDRMIEVAKMIGEKDSENKSFLWKMVATFGVIIAVVGTAAATMLGSNAQISKDALDAPDFDANIIVIR